MKVTARQQHAINWIKEIQEKHGKNIMLTYIDNYWRTCPISIDEKGNKVIHLGKVNLKTWKSLITKGILNLHFK